MKNASYGFLGCDVSKGMTNFVLQNSKGEELESNFQLDDNSQGHKTLYNLIEEWQKKFGFKKIVVGLESTGGYENNWYRGLRAYSKKLKLEVFRINPKLIYHATKAGSNQTITDGVSAHVIADFLRKNYGEKALTKDRLEQTNDEYAPMRTLHKYVQGLVKQNTKCKNAMEKMLYSSMPELLSLKGEKYPNWFLEMLIQYPSKESLLKAGKEGLMKIKCLRASKAEAIYEALLNSIGNIKSDLLSLAIKEQAQDIMDLSKKINRLKKHLLEVLEQDEKSKEDIEIITSIKGVAEDSAVGFLMEMGAIERYEKGRHLVAYFGIHPTLKQSGDKTYKPRMSKYGSSNARAIIYMMAENVVQYSPYFQNFYYKQKLKGKKHRSAIGVVMSKLTRILFGMLKTREKFDPGVDICNQELKKNVNIIKVEAKSKLERRHQKEYNKAPISARQETKRRREQNVPS